MLLFHQLFNNLLKIVNLGDVGVGGFLAGEDGPSLVEEGNDVGRIQPAIFSLDVVNIALVFEIVIKTDNHFPT